MKTSTRQKAVRAIMSTLMSSDFTAREIKDIAEALTSRDDFTAHLGYMLRNFSEQLLDYERSLRQREPSSMVEEDIHNYVKMLSLTQRVILGLMSEANPELASQLRNKRYSTRDLIDNFIEISQYPDQMRLLSILQRLSHSGSEERDAYLDHISRKIE